MCRVIALALALLWAAAAIAQVPTAPSLTNPNRWLGPNPQPPCAAPGNATSGTITLDLSRCATPVNPAIGGSPENYQIGPLAGTTTVALANATPGQTIQLWIYSNGQTVTLPGCKGPTSAPAVSGDSFIVYTVLDNTPTYGCPGGVQTSLSAFTPAQYADLAGWFDPSDATKTFSGTNCSTGPISSGTIGSIKDKGPHIYCLMFSGGAATLNAGGYVTMGTGTVMTLSTGTGSAPTDPLALTNSIPYINMIMGIKYPSANAAGPTPVFFSINGNVTLARATCGLDVNTGVGDGISARGSRVDGESRGAANAGTDTGYTGTLLAENCVVSYVPGTLSVQANNGTVFNGSLASSGGNTSATNSAAANNSNNTLDSGSLLYQLIVRLPTSAPTILSMQQGQTWVCSKMGTTC